MDKEQHKFFLDVSIECLFTMVIKVAAESMKFSILNPLFIQPSISSQLFLVTTTISDNESKYVFWKGVIFQMASKMAVSQTPKHPDYSFNIHL